MTKIIADERPEFIFHLAAQPIVSTSYNEPIETITSNVMGTANILEAARCSNHSCNLVVITSDKAYSNIEQVWGYKENDQMGGKDIYSGSKGAAELVIKSYYHSFLKDKKSNILNLNSKVRENSGITGDNKYLTIKESSNSPGRRSKKSSKREKLRFGSFDDEDISNIPCEEK